MSEGVRHSFYAVRYLHHHRLGGVHCTNEALYFVLIIVYMLLFKRVEPWRQKKNLRNGTRRGQLA